MTILTAIVQMETAELVAVNLLQLLLALLLKRKQAATCRPTRRRRQRCVWVKDLYIMKRQSLGAANGIMAELAIKHPIDFLNFMRTWILSKNWLNW